MSRKVLVKRYAVLYTHDTTMERCSVRKLYAKYEIAEKCYLRGAAYVKEPLDGYNRVVLIALEDGKFSQILKAIDNCGYRFDVEDLVDG